MSEPNDTKLMERCSKGDRQAFEVLLVRYEKPVFNAAYRMLNSPDDARDVTQTVFLKVFEHLDQYDPRYRFFSWIYRIALNESINWLKKTNRLDALDGDTADTASGPEQEASNEQLSEGMQAALMTINPDYRAVIVLKHLLGCSYHEISEILGGKLDEIIPDNPNKPYDIKKVIEMAADDGEFFEVQEHFAKNIVVGFIRLGGRTIGVIANQPAHLAGVLDINASVKGARFVRFCDAFNIPILTFVDVPGFLPGVHQEHHGIIRHGAKMLYAYAEATVPKITLALRKEYGGAVMGMCCVGMGVDLMLAWPIAQLVVLDTTAAVNLIFRKDIAAAENSDEFRQQKIEEYDYKYSNPYHAASNMLVDSVIKPRETRPQLIKALRMLKNKHRPAPNKRHGNIPL